MPDREQRAVNPNHTEESCIYPINPSEAMETEDNTIDVMDDAQAYIELIKENISYEHHMKYDKYGQRELYDECVSTLVDLIFQEPGEYPYPAGKEALDINGTLVINKEEYATTSNIVNLEIALNEMRHIEPENWNVIKNAKEGMTCKQFIKANDALEQYKKEFINIQVHFDEKQIQNMKESLSRYTSLQQYKDEILNSSNFIKLQKLYFLTKAASGELDDEKMESYKY